MQITFAVVSDLYNAGRTEDGAEFHGEVYYVQAERDDGRRWNHPAAFPGVQVVVDEDGYPHFRDVRPQAIDDAERLKRQVERFHAARGIDFAKWTEAPTAYGSAAYGFEDEYERMDEDERARFF